MTASRQQRPCAPASRPLPLALVLVIRALRHVVRVLPDGIIRALGRLLFSKSHRRLVEAVAQPREAQLARLRAILERNRDTEFGRAHRFESIAGFDTYRARVPIRTYDDFAPYIERMLAGEPKVLVAEPVCFFARTSGTTSSPKHVPVTASYLAEYRATRRAWSRAVSQVFPGIVRGHFLTMHSLEIEGRTPAGVPCGSMTAALAGAGDDAVESPVEGIPRQVYAVRDYDTKYYLVLRTALDLSVSVVGALNPSTLVLLFDKLTRWAEPLMRDLETGEISPPGGLPDELRAPLARFARRRPRVAARMRRSLARHGVVRPVDVWPRLCGALAWKGGSAPFFIQRLRPYLGDLPVMDYGYVATEGAFSVPQDAGDGRGVLGVSGHVLEFVPEEQHGTPGARALLADELEPGRRYAVIVTASHGLYRYDINDIVEVAGRVGQVAQVRFVHKGGNMLSLTGEKVGEAHVVTAGTQALERAGLQAVGFAVTAQLEDTAHYRVWLEVGAAPPDDALRAFLHAFDEALGEANIEYAGKRASQRLAPPRLSLAPAGTFEGLRRQRVQQGAPDAHVKTPHLLRDPSVLPAAGSRELRLDERP